ncbi:hypothetical protein RHMOL_Rhmol01G0224900 [Rhododendron molle]|uniref:Uncharacterized protein n=1 Tax=Rhododendron molle TaxID=49168 RepID=A0ACC0Q4L7_RHOML|nr:hypothetical protein RHMOL_Rhmol01G0224900 [Rhododendron molle]
MDGSSLVWNWTDRSSLIDALHKLKHNPKSSFKSNKPIHVRTPKADRGGSGSGGEVVDQLEDRGGPMAVEPVDQATVEPIGVEGVVAMSGGDGEQDRQQRSASGEKPRAVEAEDRARQTPGVMEPSVEPLGTGMAASDSEQTRSGSGEDANGDDRRTLEPDTRAREPVGVVGPRGDPMGPNSIVEGTSAVGGSIDVICSNGTRGNNTGPIESPPRDPAKGKGIVGTEEVHIEEHAEEVPIEREQTTEAAPAEVREEDIAFRPPTSAATSSRHVPITYDDIAEHARAIGKALGRSSHHWGVCSES